MTDLSRAPHPLDDPVRASLLGPHARFAEARGAVLRYPVDVAPFLSVPGRPDERTWRDVAELAGPGAVVTFAVFDRVAPAPPPGWEVVLDLPGVQMVAEGLATAPDPEAVRLGPADVPEILDLIEATRPGPFLSRTIEMGAYLGIRRDGELIAMAGERLHPPGWTEISAVCTAEAYRGQGLATRLVRAVAHGIRSRGETPFLHAAADNLTAIGLYEDLGFKLSRRPVFLGLRVPGSVGSVSEG